jgi:hypothetical protein
MKQKYEGSMVKPCPQTVHAFKRLIEQSLFKTNFPEE